MRAAIFDEFRGPLEVRDVPDPDCPSDGALIRLKACGICRSDWHAWNGADPDVVAPHVPGHEFAGVVEEVGADCQQFNIGDRVTAPFILACGRCEDCLHGDPTICADQEIVGFTAWGAFAERLPVSRADFNLVALPDEIGFLEAAGMGCRVTTAFRAIVDRAALQPGEWLAVHGCGGIGLSAVMMGVAIGAPVLAIDVNDEALALAGSLGASKTLNASDTENVGAAVREFTDGGAHVSIDALGITETFHNSLAGLRKLGRHIQIGMPLGTHAEPTIPLLETVYSRQISIIGTRGIAASRFPELFEMISERKMDLSKLITKNIPLEDAGASLAAMDGNTGVGITVIDRF